jgi:hypothetical protein
MDLEPTNNGSSYRRPGNQEASELGGSSQQTAPSAVAVSRSNPSELAAEQGPRPMHELYG